MHKIFIDTDVILDVLLKREPYHLSAAYIFRKIELNKIKAYTSPLVLANLHYILSKATTQKTSLEKIKQLHQMLKITKIDQEIIDNVLFVNKIKDLEDLIQYYSAIDRKIDFLITRNIFDYPTPKNIKIIRPDEFMKILEIQEKEENRP